tara:strand:- start:1069 stop:1251 length:183 start_codon:yes stop_codon:yes gene_type:complete
MKNKRYTNYLVALDYDDPQPVQLSTWGKVSKYIRNHSPEGALVFGVDIDGQEDYLGWYGV